MKKLSVSQMFSKLDVTKLLSTKSVHMHNFITKFAKILDIFKEFAGNRVNEYGNIPRPGVVPKFSDLEVIALSATAEAYGIDSENYLFKRLESDKSHLLPNIITR